MKKITPKRLFFDIETSPNIVYSWRIGYKINLMPHSIIEERKIICISYSWEGDKKKQSFTWDKNKCDKQMLIDFIKVLNQADEVIAHNGDRFDVPWLRGRCIYHGIDMMPQITTLDTLKKVKGKMGFNFNSNRLDYIARFLGVGKKIKTDWELWVGCMDGDSKSLKEMVKYCEMDVQVLKDVYKKLQPYIKVNTHHGRLNGGEKFSCPNCESTHVHCNKTRYTAAGTEKKEMKCRDCGTHYTINNRTYMKLIDFRAKGKDLL